MVGGLRSQYQRLTLSYYVFLWLRGLRAGECESDSIPIVTYFVFFLLFRRCKTVIGRCNMLTRLSWTVCIQNVNRRWRSFRRGDGPIAKFWGQSTSYYMTTTLHIVNKIYNQLMGTPIHERDVTERVNCGKWPAGLSLLLLWSPTGSVMRYSIIYIYIYIYIYTYVN